MKHDVQYFEQWKPQESSAKSSPLLIVFVLGTVLQDACERHVIEVALLVNRSFPEELIHLFVCESVAHGGQELPEVFLLDKTWKLNWFAALLQTNYIVQKIDWCEMTPQTQLYRLTTREHYLKEITRSFFVEASKSVPDDILGVGAIQLLSKHCEEHGEVNRTWCFIHHGLKVLICRVLTLKERRRKKHAS